MGKRLLTKGTASAVPKNTAPIWALAPEVRFSRHISKGILGRASLHLSPEVEVALIAR
jgi:hypothetical protein